MDTTQTGFPEGFLWGGAIAANQVEAGMGYWWKRTICGRCCNLQTQCRQ